MQLEAAFNLPPIQCSPPKGYESCGETRTQDLLQGEGRLGLGDRVRCDDDSNSEVKTECGGWRIA